MFTIISVSICVVMKRCDENFKKKKKKTVVSPCVGPWLPLLAWNAIVSVSLNVNYGSRILVGSLHVSLLASLWFAASSESSPFEG